MSLVLSVDGLPDRIKVWEALNLFGSLSRSGPAPDELRVDWGLADKGDARFGSLSGRRHR